MKTYNFTIWIDADACPIEAKDILYRYAFNFNIQVTLVANRYQKIPKSKFINMIVVPKGFDVADEHIEMNIKKDDIVITSDIPLASDIIDKGGHVVTPKGEPLTPTNIAERLSVRNFFDHLRSTGQHHSRSAAYDNRSKKAFAASMDRLVNKLMRLEREADKKKAQSEES